MKLELVAIGSNVYDEDEYVLVDMDSWTRNQPSDREGFTHWALAFHPVDGFIECECKSGATWSVHNLLNKLADGDKNVATTTLYRWRYAVKNLHSPDRTVRQIECALDHMCRSYESALDLLGFKVSEGGEYDANGNLVKVATISHKPTAEELANPFDGLFD